MVCFVLNSLRKGEIELWREGREVGVVQVLGKCEGLVGCISQDLNDCPSRVEKLAQCLVSRVAPGSPILLVRLVQRSTRKGCPEPPKKRA